MAWGESSKSQLLGAGQKEEGTSFHEAPARRDLGSRATHSSGRIKSKALKPGPRDHR